MKIGFRTFKTAVGAGFSLWIAQLLQLEFYATAATITILCIEKTRRQSVQTAFNRFITCMLALLISSVFFEMFGYTAWIFALIIVFIMPFLIKFNLQKSFLTGMVIPIHLLSLGTINGSIIAEEVIVILIGITVAMVVNSYMPNHERDLIALKFDIENHFKRVLSEFALYLDKGDQGWDKKAMEELPDLLKQAKELSLYVFENNFIKDKEGYYFYFDIREKQYEILDRMYPMITSMSNDIPQRHMFAEFLFHLSKNVSGKNDSHLSLEKLQIERDKMDELPLPSTKEELKARASIIHLMNEMELYLKTKLKMYQENPTKLNKIH